MDQVLKRAGLTLTPPEGNHYSLILLPLSLAYRRTTYKGTWLRHYIQDKQNNEKNEIWSENVKILILLTMIACAFTLTFLFLKNHDFFNLIKMEWPGMKQSIIFIIDLREGPWYQCVKYIFSPRVESDLVLSY